MHEIKKKISLVMLHQIRKVRKESDNVRVQC